MLGCLSTLGYQYLAPRPSPRGGRNGGAIQTFGVMSPASPVLTDQLSHISHGGGGTAAFAKVLARPPRRVLGHPDRCAALGRRSSSACGNPAIRALGRAPPPLY